MIELHDFTAGEVLRAADLNLLEAAVEELRNYGGYTTAVVGCATTVESRRFYTAGGIAAVGEDGATVCAAQWAENPLAARPLQALVKAETDAAQLDMAAALTRSACTADVPVAVWQPGAKASFSGNGPLRTVAAQEGGQWVARSMFFGAAAPPVWVHDVLREADFPTAVVLLPGTWQQLYEGLQGFGWVGSGGMTWKRWGVEAYMDAYGFVQLRGYCVEV